MRENDGSAFALVDIGHSPAIDFQELLEFLRHDVPVLCLFRRHARVEHLARLLGDVVKDLAHRGDTALPAKLPMSRHEQRVLVPRRKGLQRRAPPGNRRLLVKARGIPPLASKSPVYTTFCSGTRTTMSVPECPGYDSISAVSPPSSTFIGSFAGSSGRFGTASTLAFASWNTIVNAFKSLCACARSTSDLASFMRFSNGPSAAARSAPWSGV